MSEKNEYKELDGAPWTLIAGEKGTGKSRLSATMPLLYCMDTEPPGAASAFEKAYRKAFKFTDTMYNDVNQFVLHILQNTKKEGRNRVGTIEGQAIEISGVTWDTFDTTQKQLITQYQSQKPRPKDALAIWAPKFDQQDWGAILRYQTPLIMNLKKLEIPVVIVCHSKVYEPMYTGWGDNPKLRKPGNRNLDVSGSIQNWIENLCDYILHITVGENGSRWVYTQPTIDQDYQILAADRHGLFKNSERDWTKFQVKADENGYPERQIIDYICKNHVY